eukprot:CAMPEP_0171918790 /NCGR_PEP_ID=MMETSP0993-20121228/17524_1 /TAXON_ID=483369 /ORGANISM="non described non described, Strain CCMP2098" /LENGTH=197 /DNA_ID=CAMNT_0012555263 /DNA_START=227 /DNA_END=819 /DNA_ORIENTATION=+
MRRLCVCVFVRLWSLCADGGQVTATASKIASLVLGLDKVRFVSLHQGDAYPDSDAQRTNEGNTRNVCLKRGANGSTFKRALVEECLPWFFEDGWAQGPDLLVVASGYDALAIDNVAQLSLFPEDFAAASAELKRLFGNRIVFGLEGGYNLDQLPLAIVATLEPFVDASDAATAAAADVQVSASSRPEAATAVATTAV